MTVKTGNLSIIHNDNYSSDVTKAVVPLGIYTELNESVDKEGVQAPPCFFYDDYGNCITSLNGGAAIRIMDGRDCNRWKFYSKER